MTDHNLTSPDRFQVLAIEHDAAVAFRGIRRDRIVNRMTLDAASGPVSAHPPPSPPAIDAHLLQISYGLGMWGLNTEGNVGKRYREHMFMN